MDILLLSLGRCQTRHMDDLQLETVGIVKEHRVVARNVGILLRVTIDLDVLRAQPCSTLVDVTSRRRLEREMMQSDAIAVVRRRIGVGLAQADRLTGPAQVPDRLAALALDLADTGESERSEQLGVEGQAALDRGDDQVDVMDAAGAH